MKYYPNRDGKGMSSLLLLLGCIIITTDILLHVEKSELSIVPKPKVEFALNKSELTEIAEKHNLHVLEIELNFRLEIPSMQEWNLKQQWSLTFPFFHKASKETKYALL